MNSVSHWIHRHTCDRALQQLAEGEREAIAFLHEHLGRRVYLLALSILRIFAD